MTTQNQIKEMASNAGVSLEFGHSITARYWDAYDRYLVTKKLGYYDTAEELAGWVSRVIREKQENEKLQEAQEAQEAQED